MERTIEAVEKHLEALRSPLYELGVFFPAIEKGADSKMLLRTWDERTLFKSVPWLRAKNAECAAIYIRPKGEHPYSLVDDLKSDAIDRMRKEKFTPTIVIETSPANFQAWLNHGEVLDKRTSTSAARALAERFGGDPGAADWRHFGRLCGFTNRKPAYLQTNGLYPFVTVVEHSHSVYSEAANFVHAIRQSLREQPTSARLHPQSALNGPLKSIDEFRVDPAYRGDGNRVDLAFALYALANGTSEAAIRAAIETRDLTKKGSRERQLTYVSRTIAKAREAFSVRRYR